MATPPKPPACWWVTCSPGGGKHKVTADCDARNAASAALERLGMRREGHLRECTWAKGEWTDDLLYGLLHYEWNSRG